MLKTHTHQLPEILHSMQPATMVIDVGFTRKNADDLQKAIFQLPNGFFTEKHKSLLQKKLDFSGFFNLYKAILPYDKNIRNVLTEFGYSPYNFCLLMNDMQIDKKELAQLLGWSFSKLTVNSTPRYNQHFRPMLEDQWIDFVNYYIEVLKASDKKFGIQRDYEKIFLLKACKDMTLTLPTLKTENHAISI